MVPPGQGSTLDGSPAVRVGAALLCLAVTVIHVIDQGGVPGSKEPRYVGTGYYVLEVAGVVAAALLVWSASRAGWLLAAGVALGPLVGYLLSRGPGLPDYTDDVGNWGEPLGVVSLIVEGALLVLALTAVAPTARRAPGRRSPGLRSPGRRSPSRR